VVVEILTPISVLMAVTWAPTIKAFAVVHQAGNYLRTRNLARRSKWGGSGPFTAQKTRPYQMEGIAILVVRSYSFANVRITTST
jgi:hypothetical protein